MEINIGDAVRLATRIANLHEDARTWEGINDNRVQELNATITEAYTELAENAGYKELAAQLNTVQKRSRVRTIDIDDAINSLIELEQRLGISKAALEGVSVEIDLNAERFCKSYRGIPESTIFRATYKRGWRITYLKRAKTKTHIYSVTHTEKSREALVNRFLIMD